MPSMKDILKYGIKTLIDNLNRFIFIIFITLFIISLFIHNFYIDLIKILLLIIFIFRLISKDKVKRQKENKQYLKIRNFIIHPFTSIKKKDKTSVYKKCPYCKTILKLPLPKKRGINHAKCPNCSKRLTIFNLRKKKTEKIKVEVIKKRG